MPDGINPRDRAQLLLVPRRIRRHAVEGIKVGTCGTAFLGCRSRRIEDGVVGALVEPFTQAAVVVNLALFLGGDFAGERDHIGLRAYKVSLHGSRMGATKERSKVERHETYWVEGSGSCVGFTTWVGFPSEFGARQPLALEARHI